MGVRREWESILQFMNAEMRVLLCIWSHKIFLYRFPQILYRLAVRSVVCICAGRQRVSLKPPQAQFFRNCLTIQFFSCNFQTPKLSDNSRNCQTIQTTRPQSGQLSDNSTIRPSIVRLF